MEFTIPKVAIIELEKVRSVLPPGIELETLEPVLDKAIQLWLGTDSLIGTVSNLYFEEGWIWGDLRFYASFESGFDIAPGQLILERVRIKFEEAA